MSAKWYIYETGRLVVTRRKPSGEESIIQFILFGLVGLSNTIVGFGVYYLLYYCGVYYLIANIASLLISVFNAFYWNNKYVFQSGSSWWKTLFRTYISYGASLIVSTLMMCLLVEFIHVSPVIAPIICLLITIPLNFFLNKFWAFK